MHLHKEAGRIAIIGSPPGFSITSLQFLPLKQQVRTHDQLVKGSDYIALVDGQLAQTGAKIDGIFDKILSRSCDKSCG